MTQITNVVHKAFQISFSYLYRKLRHFFDSIDYFKLHFIYYYLKKTIILESYKVQTHAANALF